MTMSDTMRAWLSRLMTWRGRWTRQLRTAWRPHVLFLTGLADGHGVPCGEGADASGGTGGGVSGGDMPAAIAAFGQWCAEHEGAVCELALSSRWLLCSAHAPAAGGTSVREEAARQWAHYHDVDATALAEAWTCREVTRSDLALAVAAPRALIESLATQAKAHGVRITSVRPWWVRAVQTCLSIQNDDAESTVLRLVEPGLVTQVRTGPAQKAEGRVQAIWVEAALPGSPLAQADGIELRPPVQGLPDESDAPGTRHKASTPRTSRTSPAIWSHQAMRPVLMGEAAAWQGQA